MLAGFLKVKQNGQFRNAETLHKELTAPPSPLLSSVRSKCDGRIAANRYTSIQLDAAGAETVVMQAPEKTGAGTWITLWGKQKSDRKINKDSK